MLRCFTSYIAIFGFLVCLGGCGGSEPEFTPSAAPTADELQEAEDYERQMQEDFKKNYGGN